jgi:hypothetical protein
MAYGLAVREMRRRDAEDPTSWAYQTAVDWTDVRTLGPFRDQCQHNTWYLSPGTRCTRYGFERIAESIIQTLHEITEQTKAIWGCPTGTRGPPASTAPPLSRTACRPHSAPPTSQRRAQPAVSGEAQPSRPKKDAPPLSARVAINRGDRLPREVTSPHRPR